MKLKRKTNLLKDPLLHDLFIQRKALLNSMIKLKLTDSWNIVNKNIHTINELIVRRLEELK